MKINRLKPANDGYSLKPPGDPFGCFAAVDAAHRTPSESNFTTTARVILELAMELDAIEEDRREGRLSSSDLVERCVKVWLAIKKIDKILNSSGPQA